MSPSTADFSEILMLQQYRKLYEEQEEKNKLRVAEKDERIAELETAMAARDDPAARDRQATAGRAQEMERMRGDYNRLAQRGAGEDRQADGAHQGAQQPPDGQRRRRRRQEVRRLPLGRRRRASQQQRLGLLPQSDDPFDLRAPHPRQRRPYRRPRCNPQQRLNLRLRRAEPAAGGPRPARSPARRESPIRDPATPRLRPQTERAPRARRWHGASSGRRSAARSGGRSRPRAPPWPASADAALPRSRRASSSLAAPGRAAATRLPRATKKKAR